MKTLIPFLLLLFAFTQFQAQNYHLTFEGTGTGIVVDSVCVQNLTQCTSLTLEGTVTLQLALESGIRQPSIATVGLRIAPNPGYGQCLVGFTTQHIGRMTIKVYDPSGALVLSEAIVSQSGSNQVAIAGLGTGMYFLHVIAGQECLTGKFISLGISGTTPYIQSHFSVPQNGNTHKITEIASILPMQYNNGEILLMKGFSGPHSRNITLIPTQSQTITFAFIECMVGDSNHYPVVEIGTQLWMAENLRTTRY